MTPIEFYKILEKSDRTDPFQEKSITEQDTTPCYISSTFKTKPLSETSHEIITMDTLNPLSADLYSYYNKIKENKQMVKSIFKRPEAFYYDNMEVVFPSMKNNSLRVNIPIPTFKKVIFNNPATIILWTDKKRYLMLCPNDKTVVKVHEGDTYDPEKGMIFAILKAYIPQYYKIIDIITDRIKWDYSFKSKSYHNEYRGELTVKKDIPEKFLIKYGFLNAIRHIIIDDQLTVIVWVDGIKTFVKCNESEYDLEKAIGMAFCKKLFGNSFYRKIVKPEIEKIPHHTLIGGEKIYEISKKD